MALDILVHGLIPEQSLPILACNSFEVLKVLARYVGRTETHLCANRYVWVQEDLGTNTHIGSDMVVVLHRNGLSHGAVRGFPD